LLLEMAASGAPDRVAVVDGDVLRREILDDLKPAAAEH
jgi:hypothetical protein